jgi:RsbT co-antagonist protein rsbRD N-terminal domain
MRLSDFIFTHRGKIVSEGVTFARSCLPSASAASLDTLRDHAMGMLNAIASDLNTPQSKSEQAEKSKGRRDACADSASTAAQAHGAGRAQLGFTVEQMVSEYRALRASVIRPSAPTVNASVPRLRIGEPSCALHLPR